MDIKIEITLEDVKEFLRNSNQKLRDEIVKDLEDLPLPSEYRNERKLVEIPACTKKDGTVRKGSVPKKEWQDFLVKNEDIETIVEKEISPEWKDIRDEIENNIGEWGDKLKELFIDYKDDNVFVITAKYLAISMLINEVSNLGFEVE